MEKYIVIDIYDKCGTLTCPKSKIGDCLKNIEKHYKFYLSFETSLCQDYVIEKLYNILAMNIIPIV